MKNYTLTLALIFVNTFLFAQAPKNMVQRSHLRFPGKELSNICGYVDSLGNEYALVGTSTGMTIVDVTKPDSIFLVASFVGPNSIWREIKTWQHYAYVTTEGGGGLQIINLRNLPGTSMPQKNWTPNINSQTLGSIHALHIDNGFVYLYGSNIGNKGIVIGDLTDPWNPTVAGEFNGSYVHDGYVRHDTVWAGQIYAGTFAAIDVSNKANPILLATQQTPNNFTHNTWLSDNSRYLFTTDEVDNSYLAAYDVSDVSNIIFMDKIQSQYPGSQSIVHNTHIRNDYAITSWYKDGVVITDCHRPQNLVNVGYIDDCPQSGGSYAGVWGVYPFLPSGTIVTSDIDSGLYVYTPTYVRACYLEGVIRDSLCNTLLNNVKVEILGTSVLDSTDFTGNYKTGSPDSGSFVAQFSKAGYITRIVSINLNHGLVTNLDIKLLSNSTVNLSGIAHDNITSAVLPNTNLSFSNTAATYTLQTDNFGEYSNCATVAGQYNLIAAKWGYETVCFDTTISQANPNVNLNLTQKYQDDFSFDLGWTVVTNSATGAWVRAVPIGTSLNNPDDANPGTDVSLDCGNKAFMTGNGGGSAGTDDVDDGSTILFSPIFDLTGYILPVLEYSRWFINAGGTGLPNDSLHVYISNGTSEVEVELVTYATPGASTWINKSISLAGLLPLTSTMQVIVKTADVLPGHIVEAAFDNFSIIETGLGINQANTKNSSISIQPNPTSNEFTLKIIDFTSPDFNSEVVVSDITGRIISRIPMSAEQISFGKELGSGVYFVNYKYKNSAGCEKLIKY